jgi:hypothetical protein
MLFPLRSLLKRGAIPTKKLIPTPSVDGTLFNNEIHWNNESRNVEWFVTSEVTDISISTTVPSSRKRKIVKKSNETVQVADEPFDVHSCTGSLLCIATICFCKEKCPFNTPQNI